MFTSSLFWILSFCGIVLYWLLPIYLRWGFLFSLSFIYLATLTPFGVTGLLIWAILFYYFSQSEPCNDIVYYLLIWGVIGQLLIFKCLPDLPSFSPIFLHNPVEIKLIAPIGLSYYTFKLVHYCIEARRATLIKHNLSQFLCYIFFFPIYTAGPIEQFNHFLAHSEKIWSLESTVKGLSRIAYGLIKKFIIVDVMLNIPSIFGLQSDNIIGNLPAHSTLEIWALLLVTYLTLYLDFSAYCDIAIGTAQLYGFTIMENFNWPIFAQNIVDFWRRWHMTLAAWVQQYVFMPLIGLYRKPVLALFLSFAILGIWHELSAHRIAWGMYHASAIIIFIRWSKIRKQKINKYEKKLRLLVKFRGILITQAFMVSSMAFLVGNSDTTFLDCFIILAKLFCVDFLIFY